MNFIYTFLLLCSFLTSQLHGITDDELESIQKNTFKLATDEAISDFEGSLTHALENKVLPEVLRYQGHDEEIEITETILHRVARSSELIESTLLAIYNLISLYKLDNTINLSKEDRDKLINELKKKCNSIEKKEEFEALHKKIQLLDALYAGEQDKVLNMIKNDKKLVQARYNHLNRRIIHHAAVTNSTKIIEALLQINKRYANAQDAKKETPLFYTLKAKTFSTETAKILLENGANINAQNSLGNTIIHTIINLEEESLLTNEIIDFFFDYNPNVNLKNKFNANPLDTLQNKLKIGPNANLKKLYEELNKKLVSRGIKLLELMENTQDITNNEQEILELLKKYPLVSMRTDNENKTPLHLAAQAGNEKIVQALLNLGADIFAECKTNTQKGTLTLKTPYQLAQDHNHQNIARMIKMNFEKVLLNHLKNQDIKFYLTRELINLVVADPTLLSILLASVKLITTAIVMDNEHATDRTDRIELSQQTKNYLVKKITDSVNNSSSEVVTTFQAIQENQKYFEELHRESILPSNLPKMLEKDPSKAQLNDHAGYSLLHHAALLGDSETIKVLINKYNLDVNYASPQTGVTPIYMALWGSIGRGKDAPYRLLLNAGADLNKKTNNRGFTVLHWLVFRNYLCSEENFEYFISKGANPFLKDKKGRTVLELAIQTKRKPELINYLKSLKATPLDNLASNLKTLQSSLNKLKNALGALEK